MNTTKHKNNSFDVVLKDYAAIDDNKFKQSREDNESLSILFDIDLTQSEKIQFGTRMEKMLTMFIMRNTIFENIKKKNSKGNKETDHLFCDKNNKIIYYAEFKSNLNLDTEKSKETVTKCMKIRDELSEKYDGYEIKMFLVGLRHLNKKTIRDDVKNKYSQIDENLVGINEYLLKLGLPQQPELASEKSYKILINKFITALKT